MKNPLIVTLFYLSECHMYGDRRLTTHKIDNVFEKYLLAVKKLSADFPHHQIELHLDVAGADPPRTQRRVNYIHLRKPEKLTGRIDGATETDIRATLPPPPTTTDPEMRPIYMKDLKQAIEELKKKLNKRFEFSDSPNQAKPDIGMEDILDLLQRGKIVNSNIQKPPEENMSWLQIKIPQK